MTRYSTFLKSTSGTLMGTDFQPYIVSLIYELNCSYRNLPLLGNVQLEKFNTTAIKRSYYNNCKKEIFE